LRSLHLGYVARPLLEELAGVLTRPKLAQDFADPLKVVAQIARMSVLVVPTIAIDVIG
jgi:hypothetical protein